MKTKELKNQLNHQTLLPSTANLPNTSTKRT